MLSVGSAGLQVVHQILQANRRFTTQTDRNSLDANKTLLGFFGVFFFWAGGPKKLICIFQCSVNWKELLSFFFPHSRFRLGGWLMEGFFTLAKHLCHQSWWALDVYKCSSKLACVLSTNLQGISNYTFKRDISFLFFFFKFSPWWVKKSQNAEYERPAFQTPEAALCIKT